jgi:hypothetical protein
VRALLERAGYARDGIADVLGASGDVLSRKGERPVHLRRLPGEGPLDVLIRLFLLDVAVEPDHAERELGTDEVAALAALGMVREQDGGLLGAVRLVPHGVVFVVSDLPDKEGLNPDHVAGVHRPSITLADLTVRRDVARALDMGTGCGVQAVLAAQHAGHVVATDVNERALAFAELNAALNGLDNIETRAGSFFEPVEGEKFELVVSNPPYVISPETAYVFRDSGLGRDRVSERLVGELPGFLEEGAFGTIMASWIQEGDDPSVRPRSWLENKGCDAWILHTGVEDPLTTAAAWNRDLETDEERYAEAVDRWTGYFREEGIDALAYGSIILRRRSGAANWVRSRELPNEPRERPSEHVERLFTGPDAAERLTTDEAVAAARVQLVEGATLERQLRRGTDGWLESADITLSVGIPFSAELDGFTAMFLAQLDGSHPVGEIVTALAREHDAPEERLLASGAEIVRELLRDGFAVVTDIDSRPPAS